jgi:hypothetical protein
VNTTEQLATSASSPKSGLVALVCNLLRVVGTGAGGRALDPPSGTRSPGQLTLAAIAAAVALLASLALVAPPAAAIPSCSAAVLAARESCEFGSSGSEAGQFMGPFGVAVDGLGRVFVADSNNQRVDRFGGEGVFELAWGWGVADGVSEALQTCTETCFPAHRGTGPGEFGEGQGDDENPSALAVDDTQGASAGDVYALDQTNARIEKFSPSGEFLLAWGWGVTDGKPEAETCGPQALPASLSCEAGIAGGGVGQIEVPERADVLGVDGAGSVFVGGSARVQVFGSDGVLERVINLPAGIGGIEDLAITPAGGVYVVGSGEPGVREFEDVGGTGVEVGSSRDESGSPGALAVDAAGDLFVADSSPEFHVLEFAAGGKQLASFAFASAEPSIQVALGLAFSAPADALYMTFFAAGGNAVGVFSPPAEGFPYVVPGSESVSAVGLGSGTLAAAVNPEGHAGGEAHFEYGETAAYGSSTTPVALSGGEFENQPVSAPLSGLRLHRTYHYRVVVADAAHAVSYGPDQTFTTVSPVSVDSESASGVSATGATLEATLNPNGSATTFSFEYGTTTSYGSSVPVVPAGAGAGSAEVSFSVPVGGLAPSTTYHYRVLAANGLGEEVGPDQTFTTQGSGGSTLIDGRAWEMVTPPDKHGVSIEAISLEGGLIQAAEGGGGLAYFAKGPITEAPEGNRSIADSQDLATRSSTGWSTQEIATPHEHTTGLEGGYLSEYQMFSSDLSRAVVEPEGTTPLPPLPPGAERSVYLRNDDQCASTATEAIPPTCYRALVTGGEHGDVPPGTEFGGAEAIEPGSGSIVRGGGSTAVEVVSATPDLSRVLLTSPEDLSEPTFTTGGSKSLYEWREGEDGAGKLTLVSVLPNGKPAAEEGRVSNAGHQDKVVSGAVSRDGERVFFETVTGSGEANLYVRDLARGETIKIGPPFMSFEDASPDGSHVFFSGYECEVRVNAMSKLECQLHRAAGVGGMVLGSSEDGSWVYADDGGSIYVRHDGVTRLVAAGAGQLVGTGEAAPPTDLAEAPWRVSGNGEWLVFMSSAPLTGYDNRDAISGVRDQEVFEYDARTGHLGCISCDPSGDRPRGQFDSGEFPGLLVDRHAIWRGQWLAGSVPGWTAVDSTHALYQSRYLNDEGRVFFDSPVGLVPADGNGAQDVYEFEPEGVGGCTGSSASAGSVVFEEQVSGLGAGGCVGLISSGTSGEESAFLDASATGGDVFFMTAAKLAPQDTDTAFDIYDAHECTAQSPCVTVPVVQSPPCTTADSCRAAPAPQPEVFGPPASATFNGPGNPVPPVPFPAKPAVKKKAVKCKRGLAKNKKGRCVRKKKSAKTKKANHGKGRA